MCEVDASLQEKLKKFRFRKETNNAAILSEQHKFSLFEHIWTRVLRVLLNEMFSVFSEDRYGETAGGPGGRVWGQHHHSII